MWSKIYSEIAAHLRADNTVQQHVRDHLRDFVAVKPRRRAGLYANRVSGLWHQPLYVDDRDGILKRTDRLPEEKARRRARRNPPPRPVDPIALAADRELRRIDGFWYELRLAPMPNPVYRAVVERRQIPLKPFRHRSPLVEIEVTVRRLVGPAIRDLATGLLIAAGPEIDEPRPERLSRLTPSDGADFRHRSGTPNQVEVPAGGDGWTRNVQCAARKQAA